MSEDKISYEEQLKELSKRYCELSAETDEKLSELSDKNIQLERGIIRLLRMLGE